MRCRDLPLHLELALLLEHLQLALPLLLELLRPLLLGLLRPLLLGLPGTRADPGERGRFAGPLRQARRRLRKQPRRRLALSPRRRPRCQRLGVRLAWKRLGGQAR